MATIIPSGTLRVTLGEMFLILRRRHEMSLEYLEKVSHVPSPALLRIENDDLNVPLSQVVAAFAAFEVYLQIELVKSVKRASAADEEE